MQARMQPVGHLFSKFPRMVRDLGRTCGRQVRIEFEGQETGLDKSLLEAIRDPLTHAVRNSVDHGIEPPEERHQGRQAGGGRPAAARLPPERLGRHRGHRRRRRHLHRSAFWPRPSSAAWSPRSRPRTMTEREALQLIFVAGFSTAKEVTNVSGRGVGMDVVRSNVEKVGGSVELESRFGVGHHACACVCRSPSPSFPRWWCAAAGRASRCPRTRWSSWSMCRSARPRPRSSGSAPRELYRLREGLLPLVWLDRLLALEHGRGAEPHGFYIAVVESEGHRFGLVVDDLMAPEEIVVKPLSAALREIGIFSGATVLGNGTLAMILDVAATGARAGVRPVGGGRKDPEYSRRTAARAASPGGRRPADPVADLAGHLRDRGRAAPATTAHRQHGDAAQRVERIETVPARARLNTPGEDRCCNTAASCFRWRTTTRCSAS